MVPPGAVITAPQSLTVRGREHCCDSSVSAWDRSQNLCWRYWMMAFRSASSRNSRRVPLGCLPDIWFSGWRVRAPCQLYPASWRFAGLSAERMQESAGNSRSEGILDETWLEDHSDKSWVSINIPPLGNVIRHCDAGILLQILRIKTTDRFAERGDGLRARTVAFGEEPSQSPKGWDDWWTMSC